MKLSISRIPSMAEHGEESNTMLNISLQAGKQLAQIFQCLGVQSMRLSERETMGSRGLDVDETHFFEGVPQAMLKWANCTEGALATLMEAFGISDISLEPEEGDMETLEAMWSQLQGMPATRVLPTSESNGTEPATVDAETIEL